MGDLTGKKLLSIGIITLVILVSLWKLDFAGTMSLKLKIASSILLPLISGVFIYFDIGVGNRK